MRVLVTGAAGPVGASIHERLSRDHEVVGLDLRDSPHTAIRGSITDAALLRRALAGIDAVVHVASLHAPHVGLRRDAEFEQVNVVATEALLALAQDAGVSHWVYTSTTALYGVTGAPPAGAAAWIDEDTPPQPRTVYHRTKLAAESKVEAAARGGAFCATILRISRCFPEPPAAMALQRLHRGIDLRDVAEAHARALATAAPGCRRFVVSHPTPFERADAEELLLDAPAVLRRRAPALVAAFAQRGWPLPRSIDRVYDSRRAVAELGWMPRHDFHDLLA